MVFDQIRQIDNKRGQGDDRTEVTFRPLALEMVDEEAEKQQIRRCRDDDDQAAAIRKYSKPSYSVPPGGRRLLYKARSKQAKPPPKCV